MTKLSILLFMWSNVFTCLIMWYCVDAYATDMTSLNSMNIKLREEWNAREPRLKENLTERPVPYVVVHHSATAPCFSEEKCEKSVKAFQNYHMDTKNWNDIGYNFVIGEDGNVYEGRGWGIRGSHASAYNPISIGICIIGTFIDHMPNDKAMKKLEQLIVYGVKTGEIKDDYKMIGHRQAAATECPGQSLFDALKKWEHWAPDPIVPR